MILIFLLFIRRKRLPKNNTIALEKLGSSSSVNKWAEEA